MKKGFIKTIVAVLAAITAFSSFAACGDEKVRDGKTIYVQAYLGGYGTTYLTSLAEQFEKTYESEGYKVKVLTPSATMQKTVAIQDMYSKDPADIYFVGGIGLQQVVDGEYGTLVMDITDEVYNKPAIKFDGTEEDKPIKDKLVINDNEEWSEINGRRYSLHQNNSIGGIIVNYAKLKKYGIEELPKTSNEMFDMFDKIFKGANGMPASSSSGIYPVTYLGGSNGYFTHLLYCWYAQYTGIENYENAWNWNSLKDNPDAAKNLFDDKGYEETLKNIYKMYDSAYLAKGSSSNNIALAHTKIMSAKEGAVFMADGDWAYNEIFTDYSATISDLRFINVPVISALGSKLFGEEKGEEYLRYIIDKTDEGKTKDEIVSAMKTEKNYDAEDAAAKVEEVMRARGIYCSRSMGAGNLFISNKTQSADICYKFLRMYASEDNAALNFSKSNAYTAYTNSYESATTEYHKGYAAILKSPYAHGVWEVSTGYRKELNKAEFFPLAGYDVVYSMIKENKTKYENDELKAGATDDNVYGEAARALLAKEKNNIVNNFDTWVANSKK